MDIEKAKEFKKELLKVIRKWEKKYFIEMRRVDAVEKETKGANLLTTDLDLVYAYRDPSVDPAVKKEAAAAEKKAAKKGSG